MNVITTTPAKTVASTGSRKPRRTKLVVAGVSIAALVAAGGVAVGVADHSHGPSTQLRLTTAVQRAGLVKAERLQGEADARVAVGDVLDRSAQQAVLVKAERLLEQADARAAGDEDTMGQIHAVTGSSPAATEARTRLYQELRSDRPAG
jgi:hypothetical protein